MLAVTTVQHLAGTDGHDLALLGLLLGAVGDDDPALDLLLFFNAAHEQPIVKRTNLHDSLPSLFGYVFLMDLVGAGPERGRRKFNEHFPL